MSSINTNNAKKRRVGEGDSGDTEGLVHDELKALSSHMSNMMENNRAQTENMANIMDMMKSMKGEIASLMNKNNAMEKFMKKTLTKCDNLEKSIEVMKKSQNNMQVTQNTISENMNSRFDNVDNKLNYHEVLLENQKWEYSAPRPSPGYWNDLDVDNAAAEGFLKDIKRCTEEMRYGTGDEIEISIDTPIAYNDVFLPHWKEFAYALEQYQYCLKCLPKNTDTKLGLCGVELSDTVLELLSKALKPTHFQTFLLSENNLGQEGIGFSLKYLKDNHILKEFGLCRNTINNIKDIKRLCTIVEEHPSIEKLAIGACRGVGIDGYEMLQMIMDACKIKVEFINLYGNNISTGGDTFISDFLASNFVLEVLQLNDNELDDYDAIAIAGALNHNSTLRILDVLNNNLTRTGWAALRKAEFDDTNLNSAADSNHTCAIWYPSGEDEVQGLDTSEMNGSGPRSGWFDANYARQKKVYSVLSTRNRNCSNVGHFDDVPVELLPDVIRTVQQYSAYRTGDSNISQGVNDVNPLSLVFEVCRYWDKSLAVYELLSS